MFPTQKSIPFFGRISASERPASSASLTEAKVSRPSTSARSPFGIEPLIFRGARKAILINLHSLDVPLDKRGQQAYLDCLRDNRAWQFPQTVPMSVLFSILPNIQDERNIRDGTRIAVQLSLRER